MAIERKRGVRWSGSDLEEGDDASMTRLPIIVLSSSDDEEANRDLTLEIVERAKRRKEGQRLQTYDKSRTSEMETVSNSAASKSPSDVVAVVDAEMLSIVNESERAIKKRKNRRKNKKKKVVDDDPVVVEFNSVDGDAAVEVEEPAAGGESVITEVNDATENIVLKKLLRVPRYFDSEGCNWHFCHNCNEDGHTAANCNSEKRQKPCFVCGMVGHNPWKCSQGKSCSICRRRGHATKDCPSKEKKSIENSKICLRCGELGHDMFTCSYTYVWDDLKEIQCYVCKKFGHLCCVDAVNTGPMVVSCYNCGQHGHSGVGCARRRFETHNANSRTLCYKCGEEGHFARGCIKQSKIVRPDWLMDETSTPVPKSCKRDFAGSRSVPNDLGKYHKKIVHYEERNMTARKSRIKGGWIVDDADDIPREKHKTNRLTSSSTSGKKDWISLANKYSSPRMSHRMPKPFPSTPCSARHCRNAQGGGPSYNRHYRPTRVLQDSMNVDAIFNRR